MTPDTFMTSKRRRNSYWSALGAVPRAATFATTGLIRAQLIAGRSRQLRPLRVLVQGMWAVRDEPATMKLTRKASHPILEQVEFQFPALSCERTQSGQGKAKIQHEEESGFHNCIVQRTSLQVRLETQD